MPRSHKPRKKQVTPPKTVPGWKVAVGALGIVGALALTTVAFTTFGGGELSASEVAREGPLPDNFAGRAQAPVTIIEYASMTCSHCATFSNASYPTIERDLVAKGAAKFAVREFPLDPLATAAAMLTRCVPGDRQVELVKELFARQSEWTRSSDRARSFATITAPFGLDEAGVSSCLSDTDLQTKVQEMRTVGGDLGVRSTPTFFVDGRKYEGAMSPQQMKAAVDDALARRN